MSRFHSVLMDFVGRPFTHKTAVALSLLLHVLLVFVMAGILSIFDTLMSNRQPVVFDFVYLPAETMNDRGLSVKSDARAKDEAPSKRSSASGNEKTAARQASKSLQAHLNKRDVNTHKIEVKRTGEQLTQKRLPSGASATVPETMRESEFTDSNRKDQTRQRMTVPLVSSLTPQDFVIPEGSKTHQLAPAAKLSMTKNVRKMLQKRFKKWTENFHKMNLADSTLSWQHKGRTYVARFRHKPAKSNTDIDQVHTTVTTQENGISLKTEMRMKRLAFSNFAQFVDFWDPWVAVHDDELIGRFHANSEINIVNTRGVKPKFHGKVTTASYAINANNSRSFFADKTVFLGGIETGVKAIKLPKALLPFTSKSEIPENQVHEFNEHTWITFNADGTYRWKTIGTTQKTGSGIITKDPFYLIGPKKRRLHLSGVLKGKALVYSPGKIIIDNDLTYARHPDVSYVAEDYLGIVSDNDVEIAAPHVTGEGDLNIYACIYAAGRFVVRHLYGNGEATLHIYGSLTAGSLSATEPRYATRIHFDKRLEESRPPDFPMTDRYEVSKWDARWEVKEKSE